MLLKNTEKESITLENIKNKFLSFKNNLKKNYIESDNDSSLLIADPNESLEFKVSSTQIKDLNDVAEYRNRKFKHIYEQTKIVENITKDINSLTQVQTQKLETIDDNIVSVKDNAQKSFKSVLKTSEEDKKFKENKCWIMLLISFALFFALLIFLNVSNSN